MLFQSLDFLLFLPLVIGIYFLLPAKRRWMLILLASYGFYMFWNPWYILLLLTSTLTDFVAGQAIADSDKDSVRKRWIAISLTVNLGMLAVFKYFDFFSTEFAWIIRNFNPEYEPYLLNILLPIGISFYTFQTLGYTLDIYKRRQEPVRHLGRFAVYVAFFPQLVAGPIERAKDLLPQLHFDYRPDPERMTEGLRLFLWGLFKKLVVADYIGQYVTAVYASPDEAGGFIVILTGALFFFQVYYDFSAYQDMALGTARILGIRLSKNFDTLAMIKPSYRQFWRGWHITLTTWIRDYVYFPMNLHDKGPLARMFALMVLFFAIGLWHGANMTFIIWGVLMGVFFLIERMMEPVSNALGTALGKITAAIVGFLLYFTSKSFTLIFFRAESVGDAVYLIKRMFLESTTSFNPGIDPLQFQIMWGILIATFCFEWTRRKLPGVEMLNFRSAALRWLVYVLLGLSIWFLRFPGNLQFIYFDF